MSKENSASAFGHLNPILIPGELETSTPISSQKYEDGPEYGPVRRVPSTENLSGLRARVPSHSILKNTAKTAYDESSLACKGNEVPPIPEANSSYYSVANDVSRHPGVQSKNAQKVYFSPTKEVVSYGHTLEHDFQVDVMHLDRPHEKSMKSESQGLPQIPQNPPKPSLWVDPRIPYVLSLYLQLFFNVVLVSVVLYLLYTFISTVREDVRHKVEMYTSDALQEISLCSRQYYRNRCSNEGANTRAPALEETCMALERCMNRDPQQLGKSKITAETFAEIVNGFLHPISWKSSILFTGLIVGGVFVINVAFGTYRSRSGVDEFTRAAVAAKNVNAERLANAEDAHQKAVVGERFAATTPPNPPAFHVVHDSTLPFSSPLTGRSKSN